MVDKSKPVSPWHRLLRRFGMSQMMPRKVRSLVIQTFAGKQQSKPGFEYQVPLFGHTYIGNTSSHVDWHVFYFGAYDPVGCRLLRTLASHLDAPCFLDIGANTGTHALAASSACSTIHCFEPYAPVANRLIEHIQINKLQHVHVHQLGLSDESSVSPFYLPEEGNLGMGTFIECDAAPACHLPLVSGDDFLSSLNLSRVDLVKIDVEGYESRVLAGLRSTLESFRPIVFWEYSLGNQCSRTHENITSQFPNDYLFFKISHRNWWTRATPLLAQVSAPESRGNYLSIPRTKFSAIKNAVTGATVARSNP